MDIELYNKYIVCVYENGSLTKAAKKLGISQPALSSGLSNMEKRLGFKLFNRKSSPLQPTKEGEVYLDYLNKQKRITEDYQRKIQDICNAAENKVVVGGPGVYVESLIAQAAVNLHKEYPSCKVMIKNAAVPELIEKTRKGDVDCFVSTSDDLPEGFSKKKIKKERIYLCIPGDWGINDFLKGYRISVGEKGKAFDYRILDGLEFIFLEEQQPLQKEMRGFFSANGIVPQNYLTVNQVPVGVNLCAHGAGILFASEEALISSGYVEKLCIYALPDSISGRDIYIAYEEERYMSCVCQKLIEILQHLF